MLAARLFAEDPRPHKVNLDLYYDEKGHIPLLAAGAPGWVYAFGPATGLWLYLPAEG
jgi:hypothetical protein